MKSFSQLRRFSTFLNTAKTHLKNPIGSSLPSNYKKIPILLPHRSMPSAQGQDLDFVNIAYSHLIHAEWDKLNKLASGLTPFRIKHILLKTRKDYVLSLEFFKWVEEKNSELNTLDVNSMILHILTKNRKFKSAESILWRILEKGSSELDFPRKVFEALVYSYRMCESSPRVFDALFKTCAHMKKFRNASDSFCWMREYGFYPTVESCNAYLSALNGLNRGDIALAFYKEMCRCRISPNAYTINMVIGAYCKAGKLEMAVEVFREMERMGLDRNVVSYNTLIAGYCSKGLLSSGMKLKNVMEKNGIQPNDATYNTLINAESGNSEMGIRLFDEMSVSGVKADILTYNGVIMGLCKEGKTKKAAYMVKELDREKLVPNSSTFAALITGQCARNNAERAFQLYQSMVRSGCHPNATTFKMLISAFVKNEDYDGAVQVLKQMMERAIAPDSDILTHIYNGLCQCGKEEFAMNLCKELESQRLVPEGQISNFVEVVSFQLESISSLPPWAPQPQGDVDLLSFSLVAVTLQLPLLAHKHVSSDSTADGCMFDDSAMPDDMYYLSSGIISSRQMSSNDMSQQPGKDVDDYPAKHVTWKPCVPRVDVELTGSAAYHKMATDSANNVAVTEAKNISRSSGGIAEEKLKLVSDDCGPKVSGIFLANGGEDQLHVAATELGNRAAATQQAKEAANGGPRQLGSSLASMASTTGNVTMNMQNSHHPGVVLVTIQSYTKR
ncbi:UNVERIFIED_CONTAM: Pentatricopeptide repeat-containing protein, mitochondrial [Sesamum calycinum]|uniref:Pentatricopeptide repeat-containing protein, mitochondrial n=1 Tax=Sesamum calycinum TaxID=2727403 RepID=A0AAW2N2G2_9LAMI